MYVFYNIHQSTWVLTQSYIAGHELSKQVIKNTNLQWNCINLDEANVE